MIARVVALNDAVGFGILVDRYQGKVRGYLRQMTRESALADDLAQETFIRAWDKIASFSGRGSFSSWLMAIAHNQFLQAMRKSKRERQFLEEIDAETRERDIGPRAMTSSTSSELPDLPKVLAILTGPEQAVMMLGYGFGFSHAEITEITGLALGTVKSHIHRGKARIRAHFRLEELDDA